MKRRNVTAILCAAAVLALAGCSSQNGRDARDTPQTQSDGQADSASDPVGADAGLAGTEGETAGETGSQAAADGSILIAYFSVPESDGTDTSAGASRIVVDGEVLGNNEYVARLIQQETGGDMFAIETVQEYPGSHDALLEFAYNEMMDDARPELASRIENLDQYDTIFLGYPNWNSDMPMPMYTFLEEYDFSGKTVIPFTTHGGSGFSRTIRTIEELQPDADVVQDGLSISRNQVADAPGNVRDWISGLDL